MQNKPLPKLLTDEAAERFIDEANLSQFDLSSFKFDEFVFKMNYQHDSFRDIQTIGYDNFKSGRVKIP